MDKRILFSNDEGGVSIIVFAPGATVDDNLRFVPSGKPYLIVDAADIPSDREFRNAWTADFTDAKVKA